MKNLDNVDRPCSPNCPHCIQQKQLLSRLVQANPDVKPWSASTELWNLANRIREANKAYFQRVHPEMAKEEKEIHWSYYNTVLKQLSLWMHFLKKDNYKNIDKPTELQLRLTIHNLNMVQDSDE